MSARAIHVVLWTLIFSSGAAGYYVGQQATTKKYEPTREQHLELEVKQKDAIIAQIQFNQAQAALQRSYQELEEAAAAVKRANGWPPEIQFNQQTLAFGPQPPAPPAPAPLPVPKPAEGKKP